MRAKDRLRALRGVDRRYRRELRTFEQMVREVLDGLPDRFRDKIENVAVVIEEWPGPDADDAVADEDDSDLLGLYQGTPYGEREDGYSMVLPDRITIYRQPILAQCRTEAEVREEIRLTVLHEIGHYFGLSDDELP